jgi:hypothetical protein
MRLKPRNAGSTGVCRANWALSVMQGSEALVRVDVRDISEGGCFVEMHTLPPDQEQVKIMVWANNTKLAMRGIVASRRPGFGISVKFTEMTEQVRQQLRFFIESVIVKQEVGKILVDLCTGDKYKILSVAKPRDRTKLPDLQTWPAGKCTDEEIARYAKTVAALLRQSASLSRSLGGRGRRVKASEGSLWSLQSRNRITVLSLS